VIDRHTAFELFDLAGQRALVTGSSQGIGFALAQGPAEHGPPTRQPLRRPAELAIADARPLPMTSYKRT
jgi:gluconate 5-dehydrogenase